jgi:hypothetical protein
MFPKSSPWSFEHSKSLSLEDLPGEAAHNWCQNCFPAVGISQWAQKVVTIASLSQCCELTGTKSARSWRGHMLMGRLLSQASFDLGGLGLRQVVLPASVAMQRANKNWLACEMT